LVGDEQSGHIREVGYELYQSLLEEAVANRQGVQVKENWSPQINLGIPVMISDAYVPDLELRMALYRRLSMLDQDEQIEGFAAELIDRFGILPQEVDNLIEIVKIKLQSYRLNIAKIDVGPKGVVVTFRNNEFAAPEALIDFIGRQSHRVKVRPDQTLFIRDTLEKLDDRIPALKALMAALNGLLPDGGPSQNQSKSE
jgi:transcription-repair coupling factor (superfamily II helicase)